MKPSTALDKKFLFALLAGCAVLYVLALRAYYVGFFNDDAFFIIGAHSLLSGRYVELNQIAQPPILHYTPGMSILLAPLTFFFPSKFIVYQVLSIFWMVGGLFLVWQVFKDDVPTSILRPALVLSAINPIFVSLSGTVLSDVPLFFFAFLFLWAAKRFWKKSGWFWAGFGAAAAFLFYLRPVGACFPLALAAALLLEKRPKDAALALAAFAVTVLPYIARNHHTSGSPLLLADEYQAAFQRRGAVLPIVTLVLSNVRFYLSEIFSHTLFRWPFVEGKHSASLLVVAAGLALSITGWRALPKKGWIKIIWIAAAFYLITHLFWSRQVNRYLLPVLPIGIVIFLSGAKINRRLPWILCAASLACSFFPIQTIVHASLFARTSINTPPQKTFDWIRLNTRPEDVMGVELDGRLYLLTGRRTEHLPRVADARYILGWVSVKKPDYIVLFGKDPVAPTYSGNKIYEPVPMAFLKSILSDRKRFKPVFADEEEGAEIYRVI